MSSPERAGDGAGVRFLDDVRVLEIASLAPTQLGMHLADLGAEVIKIEPPKRGDATRLVAKQTGFDDSGLHRRWNRGKRSVAIDTTTSEGVGLLRRLVPLVDILIEGLRPGTLERMGLGWSELTVLRPNLVMVSLSGYGQSGPYRDMPSHGIAFDAISGLAAVEDDDGRPRVATRHVYYGSLLAPLFGATAALAAMSWSRRTGQPVLLDVSQADAASFANIGIEDVAAARAAAVAGTAEIPPPAPPHADGEARSTTQAYRTRDGRLLMLMALERKFFVRLAEAIGRSDLVGRVPKDQYIVQGDKEIDDAVATAIGSEDLLHWMRVFADADVPVVPINRTETAVDDPQLASRITWLPAAQGTVTMKSPVRSDPWIVAPDPSQAVGQDTAAVLSELGIDAAEIERLAAAGVVRLAGDD